MYNVTLLMLLHVLLKSYQHFFTESRRILLSKFGTGGPSGTCHMLVAMGLITQFIYIYRQSNAFPVKFTVFFVSQPEHALPSSFATFLGVNTCKVQLFHKVGTTTLIS